MGHICVKFGLVTILFYPHSEAEAHEGFYEGEGGFFLEIGLKSTIVKLQKRSKHKNGMQLNFQTNGLVKKGGGG